jgi:hypothetical protein
VHLGKGNGGAFHCRSCDAGGKTATTLVMWLDGCDFLRAVETLAGPPPDANHKVTEEERRAHERRANELRDRLEREEREREEREAQELRDSIAYCDKLWAQTEPLPAGAVTYFAGRGIALEDVPEMGGLRWHPAVPQWIGGPTRASIVARFTDPLTGAPGGIWHRPLTGEKPKALGPMKGRVIRLWPDDWEATSLVIGEGVETCLSAATRIVHRGTRLQPAWACGCRTNVRDFPILPGVECLTILADHDASGHGQADAHACAMRWADGGREAEVLVTDEIGDFNDLIMRGVS